MDESSGLRRVCVFCGSNVGTRRAYREAARDLGQELVRRGLGLVYGGGGVGLMGTISDAALAAGGEVIGVIPRALMEREGVVSNGVSDLRVVASMHERKGLMAELSDAFIALPGGLGTLEELFEVITWAQLGIHQKPVGLLDADGYWQRLTAAIDHAVAEGFVRREHRDLLLVESDPDRLLDRFAAYRPPTVEKWIELAET